jgi:hypothetical protein
MDADLDLDALLASFAGDSDLLVPSPPDAGAGSPESVTSRASPAGGEALSEIERFLMEEEAAAAEGVEGVSVDEFFDALFDGGEGGEAGGSTDGDSGRVEDVEVVTPETEAEAVVVETPETEVDGDDPISKKKRRYANFELLAVAYHLKLGVSCDIVCL